MASNSHNFARQTSLSGLSSAQSKDCHEYTDMPKTPEREQRKV